MKISVNEIQKRDNEIQKREIEDIKLHVNIDELMIICNALREYKININNECIIFKQIDSMVYVCKKVIKYLGE